MIEFNGKLYARVSDVLKPYSDFSRIDPEILKRKTNIGTMVHKAIACEINEEFPVIEDKEQWNYFKSFLRWKEEINPKFLQSEERYFCDDKMITGQIDALALVGFNHESPVLIDFKTSAQESRESWMMQAHLYRYLLEMNGYKTQTECLFVKLNKMGNLPEVFQYVWDKNIHAKCMIAIDNFWKSEEK